MLNLSQPPFKLTLNEKKANKLTKLDKCQKNLFLKKTLMDSYLNFDAAKLITETGT